MGGRGANLRLQTVRPAIRTLAHAVRKSAAILTLLTLAACSSDFYDIPKPFEGKNVNDPMIDSILRGASVEVRPIEGLPKDEAGALSSAISDAAHEQDIATVTEGAARIADRLSGKADLHTGFNLRGLPPRVYVLGREERHLPVPGHPLRPEPLRVHSSTQIRFSWTLSRADGEVRDRIEFVMPIAGSVPEFDRRERNQIATRTVAWLRATLDQQAASPGQAVARRGKPIVLVAPVEGASGDGRVSLTSAIAELLAAGGDCEVRSATEKPNIPKGRLAYRVKGVVEITDQDPNTQIVAISWKLTDLVGREIGMVNQRNAIPRGSLDGNWGQTAYAAAEGAREGLLALMKNQVETDTVAGR